MSTIESEKFAAAARTLADLEKEQEHQLAMIQVAEKEVEVRRAVANEAQERANGAAELLTDKESNLRSYRDGLSIIQQSISNVHTTLRLAHKRLFSGIDKEEDGTPDLSSDATSSSDHPGPCLSCGAIESSRFRRGGTQCNACYLRGEEDPTVRRQDRAGAGNSIKKAAKGFLELEEDDADITGSSTYSSAHEKGPCHTCGAKHFSRLRAGGML
ncbi:hypothetical protein CF319_g9165 [Tilletia indica]|nr:hypothetical protein CF319_g9165 [Tilletia indica]